MVATKLHEYENDDFLKYKMTCSLKELQAYLSVGRYAAMNLAKEAKAVVRIVGRVVYNCDKIRRYLDEISE